MTPDGQRWISSRPAFLLPVRVLSRLFRRLFLTGLVALHAAGQLGFFGEVQNLADRHAFLRYLAPLRRKNWVVYAKPPFAGPQAVLAYLARYTHRVAISNRRLVAMDERGITTRYKDYRQDGAARYQTMALAPAEFIRRFLLHVLPKGFHRLRHYGLLASASRKANLARIHDLLAVPQPVTVQAPAGEPAPEPWRCCPCCGGTMIILEILVGSLQPRAPPPAAKPTGRWVS
ncbi:Putative transposase [Acidocella aminolytica 101 = DSM 11237]|uniref:Transposase n=1 Tax=Acidocella aminolytica 101 = DSM 11237 TaxID=1120923 RepID=A0A0D6PIF3_9PROT|nr:transposase [Acidocella aminolytica 101 = DSM 11237]GBQ41171.1 putative transposase [Acidocella aminolytica 101 = DSM 11237]SHF64486.1 Putative transposase [Acidocella aminolytica 101 = DSM 11237]